jgi:hypothetical protein
MLDLLGFIEISYEPSPIISTVSWIEGQQEAAIFGSGGMHEMK